LFTGGASGIGTACAATLAREGAKVVVTDLDDAGGQAVVDKIGSAGGEALFIHQDVSVERSWPDVGATQSFIGAFLLPASCSSLESSPRSSSSSSSSAG